ncbi:MAG: hypothetical protein WKG07_28815 [Hymenobacter sp.]
MNGVRESFAGIADMPRTMRQLAVVQFFSWLALFSMWIYATPAITSHLYHTSDTTSKIYNEGADWVNVCFSVYNGVSALAALALPSLPAPRAGALRTCSASRRAVVGLISIYFVSSSRQLLLLPTGESIGVAMGQHP